MIKSAHLVLLVNFGRYRSSRCTRVFSQTNFLFSSFTLYQCTNVQSQVPNRPKVSLLYKSKILFLE